MALTDLLNGVRRLARPLALGLMVYGCGGVGEESKKLYLWGVGTCEGKTCTMLTPSGLSNTSPEEVATIYGLIREFTPDDLKNEEGCYEKYNMYRCALAQEPNLYVFWSGDGLCLRDNLLLITALPCPGVKECVSHVLNSSWYKICFGDEEP